ncbi:MAG TPA: SIMPL domain-containing protein [Vicinamibacterales bacterium]|nr:SIMPL domain-containing protein [Vicinamibacterales bacterium]
MLTIPAARRTLTLIIPALWLAVPAIAQDATADSKLPVIVTRGQATVKRAPDQAWVSIAAEARASTSAEAQRNAAEAMTSVNDALARAGVSGDAIRTSGYTLQPDMEYVNGRGRVKGYIARNQVEVRVDDLKKLGSVLDAAGASGATSMAGLRFDIKDRATAEREALRLAVQDAMGRAKSIASGANANLGAIVRIDEQSSQPPPVYAMRMTASAAGAPETPITPGELEIRAEVMLTVAIR